MSARAAAAALVAGALALRVAHVLTMRDYPLFDVLQLDAESYDAAARAIAGGELSRGRPYYQAPLWAWVLAAVRASGLDGNLAPRLLNAALGAVNVALVARLGARLFSPAAGVAAAAIAALHGTYLFEEGKVTKTALGVALATATLLALAEARAAADAGGRPRARLVAAGVLAGLTALVRENFLLFGGAAALWWAGRRGGGARGAALIAAGLAAAVVPATLHNRIAGGEWVLVTAQAGQNFYTGVHPGNPWGGYLVPDFVRRSPRFEETDFAREAERRAGRPLTAREISAHWGREGLALVAADPARFVRLTARKLGLLLHDLEIPDDEDVRYLRRFAPVLRVPLPGFGAVAALGLAGLALALARRRAPPELLLFLVVYPASVALFFVFSRYRLPLVAPLAVLGGFAVVEGVRSLRAGRWRATAAAAAVAAGAAVFFHRPIDADLPLSNSHLSAGIALEVKGEPAAALAAYREGLALEPEDPKLLRRAARLAFELAAEGTSPADAAPLAELLGRAVRANPDDVALRLRLGAAQAAAGDPGAAVATFEAILARGEEPPGIHWNLALAHEARGDRDAALRAAQTALARAPGDAGLAALVARLAAEGERD